MSSFDEDWILGTKAQSITPFQSITANQGEGDEAAKRESVNNEEFDISKANQLSTVHEFFNSKQFRSNTMPAPPAWGHSLPHLQEPPFHFLHFVFLQPFFLSAWKLEAPGVESILSAIGMLIER